MNLSEFARKNKRPATPRMVTLAENIAEALELETPDFDDFADTRKFIDKHKDEYDDWYFKMHSPW